MPYAKSHTTVEACRDLHQARTKPAPTLLQCPVNVRHVWYQVGAVPVSNASHTGSRYDVSRLHFAAMSLSH